MAVPAVITDLLVAVADNVPKGSDSVTTSTGPDEYFRAHAAIVRRLHAKGADVASAATVDLGAINDGSYVKITGTTTITSFGTIAAGVERTLLFADALTLTHDAAKIILPGAANIVTVAEDVAVFVSEGAGLWRCKSYQRKAVPPSVPLDASVVTAKIADGAVTTVKVADDAVTYAKIQNVSATDKVLGRVSAGAGDIEEIACTPFARTVLDDADADTAKATLEVGLQSRGHLSIATGLAMDASHLGKTAHYNNAADGSVTLPPIPASGKMVSFYVISSGSLTINREGTTTGIYAKGAEGAASILIHKGESLTLVSDSTNWIQQAGGRAPSAPGAAPVYACRAWVNFNGTGTIAIRAAGNVSSVTDNAVGAYTPNFTTAMQSAAYSVAGSAKRAGTVDSNLDFTIGNEGAQYDANGVAIVTRISTAVTDEDSPLVNVVVFA